MDSQAFPPSPHAAQAFMAIYEWEPGFYQPKSHNISRTSWDAWVNQFKESLHEVQMAHPGRWLKFS